MKKIILTLLILFLIPLTTKGATFGYTSVGGTGGYYNNYGRIIACYFNLPDNAKITSISAYYRPSGTSNDGASAAIYDSSLNKIGQSSGISIKRTFAWWNFPTDFVIPPGNYWIAKNGLFVSSAENYAYYDAGDANQSLSKSSSYSSPYTFPSSISSPTYGNNKLSYYATYELAPTYSRNSTTTINNGRININHGRLNIR